ncbi:MAG: 50S ribosomal protein L6 [Alphaproteobacteria bacterium]|nr:50S ribosomal protein L6 [Alphaproteobacteria bacterium]NCQ66534.1 50S ribosomal protein L6 [Alphaproteobacteria bacterium]NCT08325.1 50S ribosomal protein L6 [Alphaproteobacteria bacterium]
MSRVGKNPVEIPQGVDCNIAGNILQAKGKNGQLSMPISEEVIVELKDGRLIVQPRSKAKDSLTMWGTTQRLARNLIQGVSEGFTKRLEVNGVGYRAQVQGSTLVMNLGFSHDVVVDIPGDIQVVCEKPTSIAISGADRQKVGEFAANIRSYRPPEPYKGKGVKYENEYILRKEGKKK